MVALPCPTLSCPAQPSQEQARLTWSWRYVLKPGLGEHVFLNRNVLARMYLWTSVALHVLLWGRSCRYRKKRICLRTAPQLRR